MINNDKEINNYKKPMKRRIIFTEKAPLPVGPYNQAIMIGKVLYISGQIAINPETGVLNLETIEIETTLVMKNLKSILEAAKMNFENVIKSTIFISDMNNYSKINEVYGQFFNPENAPARETVEVANLPKFVNVEISMIAAL
jgi:2-iminobutanoate/2-iminopropanoate deaminase|tara:strand:+ start:26560 stop:26985 length:426 start_codon:yes stop_codon:yes gene_type:complete